MERVCKNCEYFEQLSSTSEYIWGDCMKPVGPVETDDIKKQGAFTWADKTCYNFKPNKNLSKKA